MEYLQYLVIIIIMVIIAFAIIKSKNKNFKIEANKEVTLNAFSEALINVKTCEGLKRNIVELNVPKIIKYNTNLINYINSNIGTKIEFFK